MNSLFKKIIAGKYSGLPIQYSAELSTVIKSLLQVNPKMRPTCQNILNTESVKARISQYFGEDYLIQERQTNQGSRYKKT